MNKITDSANSLRYKDIILLVSIAFTIFAIKAIFVVLNSTGPLVIDELLYKFNASALFALQRYGTAHYPPVYSLVLAPALFFEHWYEWMLIINAFASSLVVPATWLLARTAGVRYPLLAAALAALLPMHLVFPNMLFSENIFVPLFVLAVALALRGGRRGNGEALAFGFILGIAHLTKYLFLPALPLLFGAWLYSRSKSKQKDQSGNLPERYYPALLVFFAYSLVIGIWLCYGLASGLNWKHLFGFGFAEVFGFGIDGIKTNTFNVDSFFMWAVAYTSYIVLAWLPVWGIVTIWISQLTNKDWRSQLEPRHQRYLALVLMLVGCYWLLAVRYSFGCGYNYPIPQRLMGRYLMQLSPLMLVVGVWVLERITESRSAFSKKKALISVGMLGGVASLAWWILFDKGIWAFKESFANRVFGTVDVIALVYPSLFLLAIVAVFLLVAMICIRRNNIYFLVLPVVVFMVISLIADAGRIYERQDGLHYRELAAASTALNQEGDTLNCYSDWAALQRPHFKEIMFFWGVQQKNISVKAVSLEKDVSFALPSSPTLLLTGVHLDLRPLREYIVNDKTYYIYRIDGIDPKLLQP